MMENVSFILELQNKLVTCTFIYTFVHILHTCRNHGCGSS